MKWNTVILFYTTQASSASEELESSPSVEDIPTWAEDAFVSGTGEVVTLAERAIDLAKLGLIAQTLVAAALSSPTADLLSLGLPAVAEVHGAGLPLLALTAGTQVARITATNPTVISTCKSKDLKLYSATW